MKLAKPTHLKARPALNSLCGHQAGNAVQQRLAAAGYPELFQRLDWVSDTKGDGAGFDILSFEDEKQHRFIEVKTTNGGEGSSFLVSHN